MARIRLGMLSVVVVAALITVMARPAGAQEGEIAVVEADECPTTRHRGICHNIRTHTWYYWAVQALAATGFAWAVALAVTLRRESLAPRDVVKELESLLGDGNIEAAEKLCTERPVYVCRVVRAGLPRGDADRDRAARASSRAAASEAGLLKRRAGLLFALTALAILVGLLGTVRELILELNRGAAYEYEAADLADLVSFSLVPFCLSLMTGIPLLVAYWFFHGRATKLAQEIQIAAERLLAHIPEKG